MSGATRGCRSAGCRTLDRCMCSCARCRIECASREMLSTSPTKPHLFIGMPAYDGVKAHTVATLITLIRETERNCAPCSVYILPGCSILEVARARIAAKFLQEKQATHLLMMDADMDFAPDVVARMLAADVDLIGVSAPTKKLDLDKTRAAVLAGRSDWRSAGMHITTDLGARVEVVRGAAKVPAVGTGLLLAKRTVIQRLWDAHPELMFENRGDESVGAHKQICLMYRGGIRDGVFFGEDQSFCFLWRELGGEVHVLMDADIGHHGNYCYRANLDDLYNAPGVATKDVPPSEDIMLASLERIAAMEIP